MSFVGNLVLFVAAKRSLKIDRELTKL